LDIGGYQITYMAWIYSSGFHDFGWIIGKGVDPPDISWWVMPRANLTARYGVKTEVGWYERNTPDPYLEINRWQHIAVVYDSAYLRLYLDGILRDSLATSGNLHLCDSAIYIGLDGYNQGNHYDGKIDEVKLYDRALSPQEILDEVRRITCGDANHDAVVDVSDAVAIINYVFVGGDPPSPMETGDCNCDATCDVSDAVWIINYVFVGGSKPCDSNGDGFPDC